ncbi:PE-PPE domain-containing protein [Gordonia polyisoprenivorans]|uniref:PE-PPE domain-containing protein n=1 Tax=Gordonia polyisoprenivorans TaxID=84595 RepID=UPI001FCC87AB|nr:PE-PPE domain-containing protein [Gordonia polyisoprenivorans]
MRVRRSMLTVAVAFATAIMFVQPGFQPGMAHALQIGPIVFPDLNPPATIDQAKPTIIETPSWAPHLDNGDVVVLIPGTTDYDGSDQVARTLGIGLFGGVTTDADGKTIVDPHAAPSIDTVSYPAAFGIDPFGFPIYLAGSDTFTHSVEVGSINGVRDAETAHAQKPAGTVVINGYSQSAPIAMNVAYLLHQKNLQGIGDIPDDQLAVIVGADSRFPHTGVENVVPSFLPGMYTNGDRNPADTGDIAVYTYCVRGDATCGVGNPLINPVSTFFYLLPGFYVHAFLTYRINEYSIAKEWTSDSGNTTYIVYDGGNPWGMMLRDLGIPVPKEVDDVLSTLVPVPMPGHRSTLADLRIPMPDALRQQLSAYEVPTPRELQELLYARLGLDVPVHDPDACAATPSACQADYRSVLPAPTASNKSASRASASTAATTSAASTQAASPQPATTSAETTVAQPSTTAPTTTATSTAATPTTTTSVTATTSQPVSSQTVSSQPELSQTRSPQSNSDDTPTTASAR